MPCWKLGSRTARPEEVTPKGIGDLLVEDWATLEADRAGPDSISVLPQGSPLRSLPVPIDKPDSSTIY